MIKKIPSLLVILTFLIIGLPLFSHAQTVTPDGNDLQITINPENPEPFQTVKASLASYSFDLNRSKITWLVDGQEKKTEIGLKEFNIQTGKNGQKTTIKVVVETANGDTKEAEIFFIPSIVDLIYEAITYTPPFYKGRALNPNQGKVIVTAIPEFINSSGQKIPTKDIVFSWRKNGSIQQAFSGSGKDSFVFDGTIPIRDAVIKVNASSISDNIYASKQITITNVSPKIVFYENNPVYGIMLNKAITNTVKMISDEFGVIAVPYFFSGNSANTPDFDYVWSMDGNPVENQDPKTTFTTRTDVPGSGIANIGLKISNNIRIFQFIDSSYNISFNKK